MKAKEYKTIDFIPLHDNVIVKPIKLTKKGEFLRPQNEEDKSELGEVIAVGDGVSRVSVGDIVLFNKYSSTKIDLGDELIVRAEDITAKISKKKNG